jgi:hypothetical protein
MGFLHWGSEQWSELLQNISIVAGLLFTAFSLRSETKARRTDNLMTITKHHREIWAELYQRPGLARVIEPQVNLTHAPLTREEWLFIRFLILHISSVHRARKYGVLPELEGFEKDVGALLSLPLPKQVWEEMKSLQNESFVRFVETCLAEESKN